MISKDSIEQAYAFFHQKERVYSRSTDPTQRDEIEYAIDMYVQQMSAELYALLSDGHREYLLTHATFGRELAQAVERLESML
ncbi:hypothetical protein [Hallella colorans]|uniref:hypothetical protein n=1 Tax=Hallella colorans TaxID=1703337 RepID=UPI0023F3DA4D|nr:hypothetical protein [Hallella colorans]